MVSNSKHCKLISLAFIRQEMPKTLEQSQTHWDGPNHRKGNVAELKAGMNSPFIINVTVGTQGFDMDAGATWLLSLSQHNLMPFQGALNFQGRKLLQQLALQTIAIEGL